VDDDLAERLDYAIQMLEVLIASGGLQTRLDNYIKNPEEGPRQDDKLEYLYDDSIAPAPDDIP
jgi:hypothetical protein